MVVVVSMVFFLKICPYIPSLKIISQDTCNVQMTDNNDFLIIYMGIVAICYAGYLYLFHALFALLSAVG